MQYDARITREGHHWLADFPDCPGCQTFASSERELGAMAKEALEGWLEAHLADGQVPPQPRQRTRAPKGAKLWRVEIDPGIAVAMQIRWARADAGLTQAQLAKRAGVAQQQIAKLERPGENPSIATLHKVAKALNVPFDVTLGARRKVA